MNSDSQLTFDVLFDETTHGAAVRQLTWRPASSSRGEQWIGLWDDGEGDAWYSFDAQGHRRILFRPSDLGLATAASVLQLRWFPDGSRLIIVFENSFVLFDPASREIQSEEIQSEEIQPGEIRGTDPKISPDGQRLAFVRDNDLFLLDLTSGDETRLTTDGRDQVIFNGATDWVYWEELWGRASTGHWWSPDGQRLAYYHLDDSDVPVYTLVNTAPLYPTLERQRYPKAGERLPRVEVRVVDLETGETARLATGDDEDVYLARVHWHPNGDQVAVERLNRSQTRLDLLLCDRRGKASRVLATQRSPTWVNLADDLVFLSDGRFVWSTEETGWRQLYLYAADGRTRKRLTPEGWTVTTLYRLNEQAGWFVYQAHSTKILGAAERHIFRGELFSSPEEQQLEQQPEQQSEVEPQAVRLTPEPGAHDAHVSAGGGWIEIHSHASALPLACLRHLKNDIRVELPRRAPSYDISRLPHWRQLTISGPDGQELPAQILKPPGFDPNRSYPVIMYHYGCPSSQVIHNRWIGGAKFLWDAMMAQRDYVFFCVDNVGSAFFGKDGEDKMHRRFGEHELAAQLAGVEYLRRQPWVDASRIGLWGWSGGGASTLYCLFRSPGVWRAGMAGAPVTDWRYYDAIWIERYLGQPQDNETGYVESAPLTHAASLKDPLLLVHGTADNNVHPQNTLNLLQALIDAGIQMELALYPGARHSLTTFTGGAQRHLFERMTEFFDRHLKM